jgi:predicted nuclease of predicted toxin-antitoxin system
MKRGLLDQGLAPAAAFILRDDGWEAIHVGEVGLDRADDVDILHYAVNKPWPASH